MCKEEILKCLYCDGFDYQCEQYLPTRNEICAWCLYVDRHLEELVEEVKTKGLNSCVTSVTHGR